VYIKIKRDKTKFALFKGFRNSGEFWFWNPESEKNFLKEFEIPLTIEIQNPSSSDKDWNPAPESKRAILDSLTWGK